MSADLRIGELVGYRKSFLRSIGASATDPMWRATGEIFRLKYLSKECILASIRWSSNRLTAEEREGIPGRVNVGNLARVGSYRYCEDDPPPERVATHGRRVTY